MSTYLVTQATGQQSQWVIHHLLAAGAKVHAVVRDLQKVPPALKKEGITLFKGESINFEEILQAAQGCKGAFLNTFPIPGLEAQQAKTIVEACKKAGVERIVAATTFTVGDRHTWDVPPIGKVPGLLEYFLSKSEVEEAVRAGFGPTAYTILRTAVLNSDYLLPGVQFNFPGLPARGEIDHGCNEGVRMPYTDAHDIGKYAAAAFDDPSRFGGQEINMANQLLTVEEVRDVLARVSGRKVTARQRTPAEIDEAMVSVFGVRFHLWANSMDWTPYEGEAQEIQTKFGIPFTSFEESMQRDKARLLECVPE